MTEPLESSEIPDYIEYSFPPVEELPPPPPEVSIKISMDQLIQNARNAIIPLPIINNLKSNSEELIKNPQNDTFPIPILTNVDSEESKNLENHFIKNNEKEINENSSENNFIKTDFDSHPNEEHNKESENNTEKINEKQDFFSKTENIEQQATPNPEKQNKQEEHSDICEGNTDITNTTENQIETQEIEPIAQQDADKPDTDAKRVNNEGETLVFMKATAKLSSEGTERGPGLLSTARLSHKENAAVHEREKSENPSQSQSILKYEAKDSEEAKINSENAKKATSSEESPEHVILSHSGNDLPPENSDKDESSAKEKEMALDEAYSPNTDAGIPRIHIEGDFVYETKKKKQKIKPIEVEQLVFNETEEKCLPLPTEGESEAESDISTEKETNNLKKGKKKRSVSTMSSSDNEKGIGQILKPSPRLSESCSEVQQQFIQLRNEGALISPKKASQRASLTFVNEEGDLSAFVPLKKENVNLPPP